MGQAIFRSNTRAQTSLPSQEPFLQGFPQKLIRSPLARLVNMVLRLLEIGLSHRARAIISPSLDLLGRLVQFLHRRTDEPRKIMLSHLEGFTVRSCLKDDLFVLREGSVHIHGSTVEVARRRHGAKSQSGKSPWNSSSGASLACLV